MIKKIKRFEYPLQVEKPVLGLFNSMKPDPYGTPLRRNDYIKRIVFNYTYQYSIDDSNLLDGLEAICSNKGENIFCVGDVDREIQQFYSVSFDDKNLSS